jgi:ribosomal-protein-alanine N-acetyltransferase
MHVLNLAVKPEFQGRGIGSLLLSNAIDLAKRKKVQWARLEVRPSNLRVISLYERFGFKKIGKRRHYYFDTGEDAIIMGFRLGKN